MALHRMDGNSNARDVRQERIGFGTVGGDHVQPHALGGKKINAVIDDSDPRITYGYYGVGRGDFTFSASSDFVSGGTQTIIGGATSPGTPGSAAQLYFEGTSIAVLGGLNPQSGNIRVYIDGIETKGRLPLYSSFRLPSGYTSPIISATDTTVPALSTAATFPAAGYIYINGEVISYTSRDTNGFYGCGRGALGTNASAHDANETIYLWDSTIGLYSSDYASKQILYYNPLLSPGRHSITIVVETNTTSAKAKLFFDGFVTSSLLGASNIFTQIATITVPVITDANGHFDIGGITSSNSDVARLAYIGMTQDNTETSNTTIMGNLGVRHYNSGTPFDGMLLYYLHNGPASASFNLTLTFAFIGETI